MIIVRQIQGRYLKSAESTCGSEDSFSSRLQSLKKEKSQHQSFTENRPKSFIPQGLKIHWCSLVLRLSWRSNISLENLLHGAEVPDKMSAVSQNNLCFLGLSKKSLRRHPPSMSHAPTTRLHKVPTNVKTRLRQRDGRHHAVSTLL